MSVSIEFLRPALGDELFEQVAEKLKDAKGITLVNTADGSYIPKSKFDEEREVSKGYKAQLDEMNTKLNAMNASVAAQDKLKEQIAELQKAADGNEELKKQIAQLEKSAKASDGLKDQITKLTADLDAKDKAMKEQQIDFAVRDAARARRARNVDVVERMIDKSKITRAEDGSYTGLNEQFDTLVANDPYLFEEEKGETTPPAGGVDPHSEPDGAAPGSNASLNDMIRHAAGR